MALVNFFHDHIRVLDNLKLIQVPHPLYPDDGVLPGIEDCIIHDNNISAETIFLEETAGFSEHPAELFWAASLDNDTPIMTQKDQDESDAIFIEWTGVADPECDRLSGRGFTASALRNLACSLNKGQMDDVCEQPDLAIHHGAAAVSEYNNPDLVDLRTNLIPLLYHSRSKPNITNLNEKNTELCQRMKVVDGQTHHDGVAVQVTSQPWLLTYSITNTFPTICHSHTDKTAAVDKKLQRY